MNEKKYTKREKDGCYQTTVKALRKNGTEYWKSISSKDFKTFLKKIHDAEQDYKNGIVVVNRNIAYSDLADIYFNVYMNGKTKQYSYLRSYTKHILPVIGNLKIIQVRSLQAQSLLSSIVNKGLAKKTIKEILLIARQILDVAIKNDIELKNPFIGMKLPPNLPEEDRMPINEEQQELVEKGWTTHRMGVANMIMLYAGLRRGEMLALQWRDIDFDKKQISVSKQVVFDEKGCPSIAPPKTTMSTRCVPIISHLLQVLEQVPKNERSANQFLCPSAKGKLMSGCAYKRAWESWMNHLNLVSGGKNATRTKPRIQTMEEFTAHQLRHTYASMLYNAGVDVKTAQIRLGHSNIEITLKVYTHLSKEKEKASDDAFDAMINQKYDNSDKNNMDASDFDLQSIKQNDVNIHDNIVYVSFGK